MHTSGFPGGTAVKNSSPHCATVNGGTNPTNALSGRLKGVYYQAVVRQKFDVNFVRK